MGKHRTPARTEQPAVGGRSRNYPALSQEILRCANSDIAHTEFLRQIAGLLLDFSGCDMVELRERRKQSQCYRCEATHGPGQPISLKVVRCSEQGENPLLAPASEVPGIEDLCRMVIEGPGRRSAARFAKGGGFWTGSAKDSLPLALGLDAVGARRLRRGIAHCLSLAMLPITAGRETIGLLQLRSSRENHFQQSDIDCYETVTQTLGTALVSQRAHALLRERIKELTCLYQLAQLAERPGIRLGEILQGVVELLPAAWQYPAIAAARIVFDGRCYDTAGFPQCIHRQSARLTVGSADRGQIEVGYTEEQPVLDEGPFLQEERSLIDAVARQVAILVERREADEAHRRLEEQLRHADRLATIGQLSAGVAHELNEPLGNILAFAQLACKAPSVSPQVARDLEKIVTTSLHAREVIKKLMFFARQMPPQKISVDLNAVVQGGLYLLESRCAKQGVAIKSHLTKRLPEIIADPSQLTQVLVNLAVNAIQAMPQGGVLTITTRTAAGQVALVVADTGTGMEQQVLDKIFTPFFTTKDIHEGTGLGLPVVHGIVTSHGGTINVRSRLGKGTRFEVRLPSAGAEADQKSSIHEDEITS
jgi:signal transduction histidine kinase